jgi:hypothetical protein
MTPKWIRVTDDEMAPRFVGLNVPTPTMDSMTGQPVMQVQNARQTWTWTS